jgi:transketolase
MSFLNSITPNQMVSHRDALGAALVELGKEYPELVILSPDVGTSTQAVQFKKAFPERYFCTGISEMNTVGMAAGFATSGFIPMVIAFSIFITGKAWEMVRTSVAYPRHNVKLVGTHAGISVGPDGASHQATEDIALMRAIPGMVVLSPADANQVYPMLKAAIEWSGPVYLRLERPALPLLTDPLGSFVIGQSTMLRPGGDVAIFSAGSMAAVALEAAERLAAEASVQARVVSMGSLKPLDEATVIAAARETGALVTVEDHNMHGGLGGAVAETLARRLPTPLEMVALQDTFGESGAPEQLREKYHLSSQDVYDAALRAIARGGRNGKKHAD